MTHFKGHRFSFNHRNEAKLGADCTWIGDRLGTPGDIVGQRPNHVKYTNFRPITEINQHRARIVL